MVFLLSLFCLSRDDDPEQIITIEISSNKTVGTLKDMIKEHTDLSVPASHLVLRNVSLPLANLDSLLDPDKLRSYPTMSPTARLTSFFKEGPPDDRLHIWADHPASRSSALKLRCLFYEGNPKPTFLVTIGRNDDVAVLKDKIREKRPRALAGVDETDIALLPVSLPLANLDSQLPDPTSYSAMTLATKVSSFFGDILEKHLHVLICVSRTSPRLFTITEEGEVLRFFRREAVADAARDRDMPSTGAKNSVLMLTQQNGKIDAVYNGRPIELTGPSISIYHPVFATFRREVSRRIDRKSFTHEELGNTFKLFIASVDFYPNENVRIEGIKKAMSELLHPMILRIDQITTHKTFYLDGFVSATCQKFKEKDEAAVSFAEVKNGVGEGASDPIHKAQCDYVAYNSAEIRQPIRDACCCPAFLIGITGPYLIISGAVFADRFISQHLTDYIFLGGTPDFNERIYQVAHVLRALKLCLSELIGFYANLKPLPAASSSRHGKNKIPPPPTEVFPHFRKFNVGGIKYTLKYVKRLVPEPGKAVFKADLRLAGKKCSTVVVKFTPTYCARAHNIAYANKSAPKLWFCKKVASVGLFVVVMDFVKGQRAQKDSGLSEGVLTQLRGAIFALHEEKLVYGDLRGPNIIVSDDGERAMLLDFDWAGEEGLALYPADINVRLDWHEGVQPGGVIRREHDLYMLGQWARKDGERDSDGDGEEGEEHEDDEGEGDGDDGDGGGDDEGEEEKEEDE